MPFSVRGAPQPILRRQLDILGSSFFEDSFDITEDGRQLEFNGETVESRSPTPQQERRYERGGFHFRKFASLARKDETFANYLGRRKVDLEHMHVLPESLKAADIRKIISIVAVCDEFLLELAQEVPNRKRHRRLRSKKVVPEIYTGAQAIFSICEGNPRLAHWAHSTLLDAYKEGRRVEGSGIVQRAQQARRTPHGIGDLHRQERALVFLCTLLTYLLVASERSAGIENSCPRVRFTLDIDIDGDSIARRKCLFERFVE
jgi:hypothetical protein